MELFPEKAILGALCTGAGLIITCLLHVFGYVYYIFMIITFLARGISSNGRAHGGVRNFFSGQTPKPYR